MPYIYVGHKVRSMLRILDVNELTLQTAKS